MYILFVKVVNIWVVQLPLTVNTLKARELDSHKHSRVLVKGQGSWQVSCSITFFCLTHVRDPILITNNPRENLSSKLSGLLILSFTPWFYFELPFLILIFSSSLWHHYRRNPSICLPTKCSRYSIALVVQLAELHGVYSEGLSQLIHYKKDLNCACQHLCYAYQNYKTKAFHLSG